MVSQCTKYEVSRFTRYEAVNGGGKCRKWGGFYRFYRAMLCIRGTSHGPVSVCVRVRLSQVGVLLKRLNVGSHKEHHTIA